MSRMVALAALLMAATGTPVERLVRALDADAAAILADGQGAIARGSVAPEAALLAHPKMERRRNRYIQVRNRLGLGMIEVEVALNPSGTRKDFVGKLDENGAPVLDDNDVPVMEEGDVEVASLPYDKHAFVQGGECTLTVEKAKFIITVREDQKTCTVAKTGGPDAVLVVIVDDKEVTQSVSDSEASFELQSEYTANAKLIINDLAGWISITVGAG